MYPLASRRQIGGLGVAAGAGGITLPYTFDPSALGDGALPAPWVAPTFSISSGVVINSPSFGSELLTDGGLEANYTSGLCDTLTKGGSPTLAESADAQGGSKAQSFNGAANNEFVRFATITPTTGKWYRFVGYGKRTAGSAGQVAPRLVQTSGVPAAQTSGKAFTDAAYSIRYVMKRAANTNAISPAAAYQSGTTYDTVLVDTFSFKQVSSDTPALIDSKIVDHIVKTKWNWTQGTISGTVAKASADGTSFLVAYYFTQGQTGFVHCILDQCVAGTWSNLIADWTNSPTAGSGAEPTNAQWLTISVVGTTAQLFQNDIQVGADVTINAALANNTHVGIYEIGGVSQLAAFFAGAS